MDGSLGMLCQGRVSQVVLMLGLLCRGNGRESDGSQGNVRRVLARTGESRSGLAVLAWLQILAWCGSRVTGRLGGARCVTPCHVVPRLALLS